MKTDLRRDVCYRHFSEAQKFHAGEQSGGFGEATDEDFIGDWCWYILGDSWPDSQANCRPLQTRGVYRSSISLCIRKHLRWIMCGRSVITSSHGIGSWKNRQL